MPLTAHPVSRWPLYWRLLRLDKPIGILLLLWPTVWGLWMAGAGAPDPFVVLVFVVGTVLMRSAGCALNDIADRRFDGHVARTCQRPLATGALPVREALAVAAVLVGAAFALVLPLNALVIALSVPALFLAASYPYTKRFLAVPQAYLGVAFGFGIPMAFAAHLDTVPALAWVLMLANVFWAVAYDTEYAMVDRDDDIRIGIRTSALTFGRFDVLAVMCCYVLALALLAVAGGLAGRQYLFFGGLLVAAVIAHHHYGLIRTRERDGCFRAFLHNNWFGAAVSGGLILDYLVWPA